MSKPIYIPFLTPEDLVQDNQKRLIPGAKICIFDPVSNNPVDIYTYDGANERYVVAENPIYLGAGSRPVTSYFSTRLVLCRLYKYAGQLSDPRLDDDSNDWKFVREWNGAFSQNDVQNDTIINGLEGLQEANPELGKVTVVGYWTDDDCEARTYVWNPTSVAEVDNGYVVGSNSEDVGRWILEFDGEWLPSTYYGVYPGREANINALLTYPAQIGTELTAPGIYFKPGDYSDSSVALVTDKKVLIDATTRFTRNDFTCRWVNVVGEPELPICDFYVTDKSCPVHSSWYKSCIGFWTSGSDHLYIDKVNHQTNKNIQNTVSVQDRTIYGQNRLPQTYGQNGRLYLDGCSFVGENLFSSDDKLRFAHTDFTDSIFSTSSADLDFADGVIVRSNAINQLRLDNFKNVIGYIKALAADGQTILDLGGRPITQAITILNSPFVKIRNIYSDYSFSISNGMTYDLTCENVHLSEFYFGGRYLDFKDSEVAFGMEPNQCTAVWAYNSTISSAWKFTRKDVQWSFERCVVGINFETVTDNETDESLKIFHDCILAENTVLSVKRLEMVGCTTTNCSIKIYPYKTTTNSEVVENQDIYHLYCWFEDNMFNNSSPIEFTKLKVDQYGQNQEDDRVYDIIVNWTFVNNCFRGNSEGIRCRYWQNRLGNNYNRTFIKMASVDNYVEYLNNTGNCPSAVANFNDGPRADTSDTAHWFYFEISEDHWISCFKENWSTARIMPKLNDSSHFAYNANMNAIGGNGFPFKYRQQYSDAVGRGEMFWIYPWSHVNEPITNGDLFRYGLSVLGKVGASSPGAIWTYRFI